MRFVTHDKVKYATTAQQERYTGIILLKGSCAICVVVYYYLKVFSGKLKMFIVNPRANTKNKEYITNKPMK